MTDKDLIKNFRIALENQKKGNINKSIDLLKKNLDKTPNHFESNFLLGVLYIHKNNFNFAIKFLSKADSIKPNLPDIQNNLGRAYMRMGEFKIANKYFIKTVEINPKYYAAFNNLGLLNERLENFENAILYFKKAINVNPQEPVSYYNLANLFRKINDLDNAEKYYLLSIEKNSNFVDAFINLLDLYERTNRKDKLDEKLKLVEKKFINNSTINLIKGKNYYNNKKYQLSIETLKDISFDDKDLKKEMTRLLIIAKSYDKINNFEKAFIFFKKSNYVSKNNYKTYFNKENSLKIINDRITFFKNYNTKKTYINKEKTEPIFLVGFPRSGTTLLDTVLRSNNLIHVIEEKPIVQNWIKIIENDLGKNFEFFKNLNSVKIEKYKSIYFEQMKKYVTDDVKNKILIDKMPLNIIHLAEINNFFPNAKFIVALRHPCDCVLSCFMQSFEMNDAMSNFYNLKDTAVFYDKVMSLFQIYKTNIKFHSHVIKYEEVVYNFDKTIKNLCSFLNVKWSNKMKDFYKNSAKERLINTPSYDQVNQPIYNNSVYKWRNYQQEFTNLLPLISKWIKKYNYDLG